MRLNRWMWITVGILLCAALLRISTFSYGLPYVDHVDEPNFYLLANDQRGVLDASWRENWLAGYPPGYIWFSAQIMNGVDAVSELNIHTDMGVYIAILRYASLLFDLLTLAALMTLARWLGGNIAGVLAGVVYLISAEVLDSAIIALPDPPTVLFTVLCALFTVRALRHNRWQMAIIATVFGLLAVAFKYPVFPVLFLPAAFFVRDLWQRRLRAIPAAALALAMVAGMAFYLLVINGAASISNAEGLRARTNFFSSLLTPRQWEVTLNAFIGTVGLPLLIFGAIALVWLLLHQKSNSKRYSLWLVLGVGVSLLAIVPGYVTKYPSYPVRYIWPAAAIMIPALAALVAPLLRKRTLFAAGAILLPLVIGLPELATFAYNVQRPYTYLLAQNWFEQNIPDGSIIWIEGFLNYRSLSRYEAGYSGFNNYGQIYGSDRERWNDDFPIDYIYLSEPEVRAWPETPGWEPLANFTLIKRIGNEGMNRDALYIYTTDTLASQQETLFHGSSTIELRGIDVQQGDRTLFVSSYWQAPENTPPVDYSYTLYLTPLDAPDALLAQSDAALGHRPTSTWSDPEEVLRGSIQPFTVPDDVPAGEYALWIGIYYWETGERLTLDDGSGAYFVGEIQLEDN